MSLCDRRRHSGFEMIGRCPVVLVLVVLALLPACRRNAPAESGPVAKASDGPALVKQDLEFVGSAKCAECHEDIASVYSETHSMAHSMSIVGSETTVEDYERGLFSPPGNRTYQVARSEEGVFHHEIMFDRQGEPIFDQAEQIAYVLGSGRRGRSYLIDRGGLLFQSPIAWYSQKHDWALAPGYRFDDHQRFDRRIRQECLFCHAGRVQIADPGIDRYAQPAIIEGGIGCERCHGPGEKHVALHTSGHAGEESIVNPSRLEAAQRDSVCYQCHVRAKLVFEQHGRSFLGFRPGEAFVDNWAAFVETDTHGGPQNSLVEQFRSSKCFQASEGRLGCISCHDPHMRPKVEDRAAFYRDRCLQCHKTDGCSLAEDQRVALPAAGSCIHCHMPPTPTPDIPHTALVDHRVPRIPSNDEPPAPEAPPAKPESSLTLFLESEMPQSAANRAKGLILAIRATNDSDPQAAAQALLLLNINSDDPTEVVKQIGDDMPVLARIGIPFAILGRPDIALKIWERALELEPTNDAVLNSLALLHARMQQPEESLQYFDRLIEENPHIAEYHWLRSRLLEQNGQLDEAIRAVERVLEADPTALPARAWLVEALMRTNQPEAAAQQRAIMNRMRGQ